MLWRIHENTWEYLLTVSFWNGIQGHTYKSQDCCADTHPLREIKLKLNPGVAIIVVSQRRAHNAPFRWSNYNCSHPNLWVSYNFSRVPQVEWKPERMLLTKTIGMIAIVSLGCCTLRSADINDQLIATTYFCQLSYQMWRLSTVHMQTR